MSQDECLKGAAHKDKILICAFLARVMHGKELGKFLQIEVEINPSALSISVYTSVFFF